MDVDKARLRYIQEIAVGMFKEGGIHIDVRPRMWNWPECITWRMKGRSKLSLSSAVFLPTNQSMPSVW